MQEELEKIELASNQLGISSKDSGSVVDVGSVFLLLKTFRSEFERADISIQSEILRDIVSEVLVKKDGVLVKIFGLNPQNSSEKHLAVCRPGYSCRIQIGGPKESDSAHPVPHPSQLLEAVIARGGYRRPKISS